MPRAATRMSLGVPHLDLRLGTAPDALKDLPTPDAVFVGGGASRDGVLDAVWQALAAGRPAGGQFRDAGNRGDPDRVAGAPWRHLAAVIGRARRRGWRPHRLARRDAGGAMERHQMKPTGDRIGLSRSGQRAIDRRGAGRALPRRPRCLMPRPCSRSRQTKPRIRACSPRFKPCAFRSRPSPAEAMRRGGRARHHAFGTRLKASAASAASAKPPRSPLPARARGSSSAALCRRIAPPPPPPHELKELAP